MRHLNNSLYLGPTRLKNHRKQGEKQQKLTAYKRNFYTQKYPATCMVAGVSFMVIQEGFEPPTHGLEGRCSIQLSY